MQYGMRYWLYTQQVRVLGLLCSLVGHKLEPREHAVKIDRTTRVRMCERCCRIFRQDGSEWR